MAEIEQAPLVKSLAEQALAAQELLVEGEGLAAGELPEAEKPPARFWFTGGRVLIVVAVLGLIGLLGWGLYQVQKKPLEKGLAPDFSLTSFEGKTYTLSKLRGKVVIINITYFNGPDLGTRIAQLFNIKGVPETYYVAKDGTLRGNHIGPLQEPELDNKIDELLAESYPSK